MPFFVTILIQIAISIALALIAYALAPKPKAPKPEAATDLENPTSEAGRPLNVVFGDGTLKSPNALWFGNSYIKIQKVKV